MARRLPVYRRGPPTSAAFAWMVMVPTFFTMAIAGVWHGAGLQFLVFGLLHACYLTINHAWRGYRPPRPSAHRSRLFGILTISGQVLLTYLAVLLAQIFFRASSVPAGLAMLSGMIGLHGMQPLPVSGGFVGLLNHLGGLGRYLTENHHILTVRADWSVPSLERLMCCYLVIWAVPNSQRIMAMIMPAHGHAEPVSIPPHAVRRTGRAAPIGVAALAGALFAADLLMLQQTKVFLYFQF